MNLSVAAGKPRVYRIAVSAFFFISGLTFSTWASRIPDIKTQLQLSDARLGAVLFALPAGLMMSLLFAGWLVARFGSRRVMVAAAIFYPAILVLLGLSGNVWQLVFVLFLFGLGSNLVNIAMNTQAVAVESMYGRSVMASFHGLWSIAGFSGAAIGTLLISAAVAPWIHFGIIFFIAALGVLCFYKYTLPTDAAIAEKQPFFVKPDRYILNLGLIAFCSMLCEGAMADWSGVYFQNIVQAPKQFITLGYVAFTAAMATGRFLGDNMVTKLGIKKVLQLSATLIASGLLMSVLFPYMATAITGFLLVGLGVSSVVPLIYSLAGKSGTMQPGLALAAVSSISFLGFLIGPPLIGFIAEAAGLRLSFAIIAVVGSFPAILANKIKER
ncbi:MAG: MFS transporter [Chitinophagaceae bacterium]